MEHEKTLRQSMMDLLKDGDWTARDLSQMLSITEREVISHLYHVAKSAEPDFHLNVKPSVCKDCGYTFETRKRLSKPSKCPQCRHQHITSPSYSINPK